MGDWLRILVAKGVPVTFMSATISASFNAQFPRLIGLNVDAFYRVLSSVSRSNLVCERKSNTTAVVDLIRTRFEDDNGEPLKGVIVCYTSTRQCLRLADEVSKKYGESGTGMTCGEYYENLPMAEQKTLPDAWKSGKVVCIFGTEALAVM